MKKNKASATIELSTVKLDPKEKSQAGLIESRFAFEEKALKGSFVGSLGIGAKGEDCNRYSSHYPAENSGGDFRFQPALRKSISGWRSAGHTD
jgi:hypothetical protein